MSSLMKTRTRFLLVVLGFLLALVLLELILRLVEPRPSVDHEHLLPGSPFRSHPDYIMLPWFLHQPDFLPREKRRSQGRPVVVCLGDSFTQGYPVDPKDSYPAVLEREFPDACFVNIGIGDSGPDRQLAYLQRTLLSQLKPDLVVWAFYSNDVTDNWRTPVYDIDTGGRLAFTGGADHWIVRRDRLVRSSRWLRGFLRNTYVGRHLLQASRRRPRPTRAEFREDLISWSLQKIRLELEEMRRLAKVHDFGLLVVRIAPQSYYDESRSENYSRLVSAVPEPDIEVVFASPREMFCEDGRDLNPHGDRHFNERGYRAMAKMIAPHVARQLKERSELRTPHRR